MTLTSEGLGPVKIGFNLQQISEILKTDISKAKHKYFENDCSSYSLGDHPIFGGNVRFLINKGTLGEISIYTEKIKTDRGLTVKKSIAEAESLYAGLFKKGKTHYGDIELSIEYPESKTKMKMVGSEEYIRYISVGRKPEIDFIEGCL
jgi:hypothetical protein